MPSPKVATYDQKPEMSAYQVTDKLEEAIASGKYDLIVVQLRQSRHGRPYRHDGSRDQGGGRRSTNAWAGCAPRSKRRAA